jgi:hypothetical protein
MRAGFRGVMFGIEDIIATIRKYKLAKRLYCEIIDSKL